MIILCPLVVVAKKGRDIHSNLSACGWLIIFFRGSSGGRQREDFLALVSKIMTALYSIRYSDKADEFRSQSPHIQYDCRYDLEGIWTSIREWAIAPLLRSPISKLVLRATEANRQEQICFFNMDNHFFIININK